MQLISCSLKLITLIWYIHLTILQVLRSQIITFNEAALIKSRIIDSSIKYGFCLISDAIKDRFTIKKPINKSKMCKKRFHQSNV